ncbi:MAG: hypothetical protein ACLQFI_03410 [Methylocella sp.]|jgi:hypothetical protein
MDGGIFVGPAVIAAAVSGIISVIGFLVSTRTARALHTDKLKFDERLAERKFEFDKELAERRFKYDRGLDDHKRRVALTEDVLTTFYHVKDVLVNARNPFSFGNEGVERPRRGDESEGLTRLRNSYYVPIARLNKEAEIFAKLYGSRYRFKAYFGEPADEPFKEIHRIRVEIVTAAEALIDSVQDGTPDHDPQFTKDMRDTIWHRHNKEDAINKSIDVAIKQIEDICRPILQGSAATP